MTTDFRDVFAEVISGHLEATSPELIFPDYTLDKSRFKGLIRT